MPRLRYAFFIIFSLFYFCNAQSSSHSLESVFNNKEGIYEGTVKGVLFLEIGNNEKAENDYTILDFKCCVAKLKVVHEEEEIYDSHFEHYIGFATSGEISVKYSTYAAANELQVKINNDTYEISTIDGACMDKVEGIKATYHSENNSEYLVLHFTKDILLSNAQPLLREYSKKHKSYNSYEANAFIEKNKKYVRVLPESVLIFVIDG